MSSVNRHFAIKLLPLVAALVAAIGCRSTGKGAAPIQGAKAEVGACWRACPTEVITDTVPEQALPLPLSAVRLTGGPLKRAQELDEAYLLKLNPDRMLYYFEKRAGLKPTASEGYGGWDGGGRNLTGHIAGHYLSAVSYMYAATGDSRFKQRADYLVQQFKRIQDKQGDGYIGAQMGTEWVGKTSRLVDGKILFEQIAHGDIRSGGFDLNGMWSPWYVEHKIFAGLRDAYRETGNRTALEVEVKLAGWVESIVGNLTEAQDQKMLNTEFGGMNEVLADLYADTGNKRWLALSGKFEHKAIIDPLARHDDILGGKHVNTEVAKIIGSLARYVYSGDATDGAAANFFWEQTVYHHSFATGGQGHNEYFGPPDKLNDIVNGRDDESCPVYNMLKMSRTLFSIQPNIKYAAYMERALFNHVLASIDPTNGRTCYMVPVGQGVQHEYQNMFQDFTCCVGTGMEDHALLGYGLYFEAPHKLWVNLYAPSVADWKAEGVNLKMETGFPLGKSATLHFSMSSNHYFTLALRRPAWAGQGFEVTVNDQPVKNLPAPGHYVEIERAWKNGDKVEFTLPKKLHKDPLPDNPDRVALMWGPLVLAGDLGPERGAGGYDEHSATQDQSATIPVFVAADQPVFAWLKPVTNETATFRTAGVGRPHDVTFKPFYLLPDRTYGIYWDLFTPQGWVEKSAELAAERERQHKLELATVAFAQPGEMQSERDYNEQGQKTWPDRVRGRAARRGRDWFSFDMPVDPKHPMAVVVTYYSDEWRKRTFDILADGQKIGEQVVEKGGTPHFFDEQYAIPHDLVKGKKKVAIRFQATHGNEIAAVFGIRVIRADADVPDLTK